MIPPSLLVCIVPRSGPDGSPTARVQRGFSETARCASTGDPSAPLLFLLPPLLGQQADIGHHVLHLTVRQLSAPRMHGAEDDSVFDGA